MLSKRLGWWWRDRCGQVVVVWPEQWWQSIKNGERRGKGASHLAAFMVAFSSKKEARRGRKTHQRVAKMEKLGWRGRTAKITVSLNTDSQEKNGRKKIVGTTILGRRDRELGSII